MHTTQKESHPAEPDALRSRARGWQMLHAQSAEGGIIDTVMQGGDTDTNAAIAGALLGALHGEDSLPGHWREAILNCRPSTDNPDAVRVRPHIYWPADALELADALLIAGRTPRNA